MNHDPILRSTALRADVATIVAAGGIVSDEYTKYEARLDAFLNINPTNRMQELRDTAANLDRSVDDLMFAYEAALTQETAKAGGGAQVRIAVVDELAARLTVAYRATAISNYETLAAKFTKAGEAFTKAHKAVPVTTDPAKLVDANAATRKAWSEGQTLVHELDPLADLLRLAAKLAGKGNFGNRAGLIGATVNAEGCHRRRIWEAFDEPQKWAAVVDAGATLEAPDFNSLTPYREPRPMETRYERGEHGVTPILFDPEDATALA